MESILVGTEIELYVETMTPQKLSNIGTKQWLEWHKRLQKLNQQAVLEASTFHEEFVKETLVVLKKAFVLIHEAIAVNIWKYKILPLLLKLEPNPQHTFIVYTILYHETVCVSLLELSVYHSNFCEILDDYCADLLDYVTGNISQLLVVNYKESKNEENGKDEIQRHVNNLSFENGVRSLSIIRYITSYLDILPYSISSRIFLVHDIPILLTEILLKKPWIRDNKQYYGGQWVDWDGEVLTKAEAQIWVSLLQLLLVESTKTHYPITDSRKSQLSRLMPLLTPITMDQLAPLAQLKRWLSHILIADISIPPKPILMETILEIKEFILADVNGEWKKITEQQLPLIFPQNQHDILENAQILNDAFNTDLLEQFETNKNKYKCEQCAKEALQRCSSCKKAWYCSRACQVAHWPQHNCIS